MTFSEIIQIITAFTGSLGFAVIFNIRGGKMWVASLGGMLSWAIFIFLGRVMASEALRYFIIAAFSAIYSEVFARIMKTPTSTFVITSLIPLIPGSALYYTMQYALQGDMPAFSSKAVYTLKLALALAVGIILVTSLIRVVKRFTYGSDRKKSRQKG